MKKGYACFVDCEEMQVEDGNRVVHIGVDDEFFMMMLKLIWTLIQICIMKEEETGRTQ